VGILCRSRGRLHEKDVFAPHGFAKLHCNVSVRIRVITQCAMPALLTGQIKMQLRQAALMGVNFSPSGLG